MYRNYLRRLSSNANLSKFIRDTAAKKNSDVQIKKQRQNIQKYWKERLGKENKCDVIEISERDTFEQQIDEFSSTSRDTIKKFEDVIRESRMGKFYKYEELYKRRILFLNGNELDFVTQEIIENEKRIGIPILPSRIKKLMHNLNALNEYGSWKDLENFLMYEYFGFVKMLFPDQSEKEKKFIEGLFHIMLHFASLFSKNALILDTELDIGVTYIYKPLDIIRNWADVNMGKRNSRAVQHRREICSNENESRMMMDVGATIDGWEIFAHENCFVRPSTSKKVYKDRHKTAIYNRDELFVYWKHAHQQIPFQFEKLTDCLSKVRSWGLVSLGDNDGRKGLHWELFTMRQPHPGVFYWTQVSNIPLPSRNSKKSFLTFTPLLETVFILALGLEETSENIRKVNQTIAETRFGNVFSEDITDFNNRDVAINFREDAQRIDLKELASP